MANKYKDELDKEKNLIKDKNPFNKLPKKDNNQNNSNKNSSSSKMEVKKNPHYEPKEKSTGYFNLILNSDYQDLELEIKGLRYVSYIHAVSGKEIVTLEKRPNHYLNEEGAEELLMEIKGHVSSDIKLGFLKEEEFLMIQDIIRKTLIKYIKNNLERLGMDTEYKQRKARPLIVMILNRIRAVYSRSIQGTENKRSHGDINLSGGLDGERDDKFKLEDNRN